MVAIGVGAAITGTLLILILAVVFRSRRFCFATSNTSPILRANGTGSTNCEKGRQVGQLISPQDHLTTSQNNSTPVIGMGGYRAIPQSKSEADANPDIIPGANCYPTGKTSSLDTWSSRYSKDYVTCFVTDIDDDVGRAVLQTSYMTSSFGHGESSPEVHRPGSQPLPLCRGYNNVSSYSSLDRRGPFQSVHYNSNHSAYQSHPKPPNCYPRSPQEFPHNSPIRPTDYNTIYIREKLFHDSDIPESCV